MVGVAGRSKGCHTCKKRRVKCDEQKPECARCLKAGYTCKGYARALEIRMSDLVVPPAVCTVPAPKRLPAVFDLDWAAVSGSSASESLKEQVPPFMSLVAFKDPMHFAFFFDNFVWSTYGSPWLQLSAEGKLGALSHQACKAVSQATFGQKFSQRNMELESAASYGETVMSLRQGLSQPGDGFGRLLVPMLILLIYASVSASRSQGESHIRGMMALLQACGPAAFREQPLRNAFSSCRSMLITVAMISRRRTMFESLDWRTLPWDHNDHTKSNQDQLVDILSAVPGLMEDWTTLQQTSLEPTSARRQLCLRVQRSLELLYAWRCKWDRAHLDVAWEQSRPIRSRSPAKFPLEADRMLCYRSFSQATEYALYNATLLCLLGILYLVETPSRAQAYASAAAVLAHAGPQSADSKDSGSALSPPGQKFDLRTPAIEVVRTFEYQLSKAAHSHDSALFWLFPLGMANKVLEDEPDWARWIQSMLDASQGARGYGRGKDNVGFAFAFFPMPKVPTMTEWDLS